MNPSLFSALALAAFFLLLVVVVAALVGMVRASQLNAMRRRVSNFVNTDWGVRGAVDSVIHARYLLALSAYDEVFQAHLLSVPRTPGALEAELYCLMEDITQLPPDQRVLARSGVLGERVLAALERERDEAALRYRDN